MGYASFFCACVGDYRRYGCFRGKSRCWLLYSMFIVCLSYIYSIFILYLSYIEGSLRLGMKKEENNILLGVLCI